MSGEDSPPHIMTPTKRTKNTIGSYNNIGSPTVRPSNIIPNSPRGLGLRTRSAATAVTEPPRPKENANNKTTKRPAEDTPPHYAALENPKRGRFEAKKGQFHLASAEAKVSTSCEIGNRVEDGQPSEFPQHNSHLIVGTSITDPSVRVIAFITNAANQLKFSLHETDLEKSLVKFHRKRLGFEQVLFDPQFSRDKENDTREYIRSLLTSSKGSSGRLIIISIQSSVFEGSDLFGVPK
jgi:hypothetical protein